MKKRFVCKCLAIIFVLSLLSINSFAIDEGVFDIGCSNDYQEAETEAYIDEALIERGFPKAVVENLPFLTKRDLYNSPERTFAGGCYFIMDESTGEYKEISLDDADYGIELQDGALTKSELGFVCMGTKNTKKPGMLEITVTYEWKTLPLYRYQDIMAISWDSMYFEMEPGTFHRKDFYDGIIANEYGSTPVKGLIKTDDDSFCDASPTGVSWYADLKGYVGNVTTVTKLYGEATWDLNVLQGTNFKKIFYGKYVHKTGITGTLGINIKTYGALSITGSSDYTQLGDSWYVEYK